MFELGICAYLKLLIVELSRVQNALKKVAIPELLGISSCTMRQAGHQSIYTSFVHQWTNVIIRCCRRKESCNGATTALTAKACDSFRKTLLVADREQLLPMPTFTDFERAYSREVNNYHTKSEEMEKRVHMIDHSLKLKRHCIHVSKLRDAQLTCHSCLLLFGFLAVSLGRVHEDHKERKHKCRNMSILYTEMLLSRTICAPSVRVTVAQFFMMKPRKYV